MASQNCPNVSENLLITVGQRTTFLAAGQVAIKGILRSVKVIYKRTLDRIVIRQAYKPKPVFNIRLWMFGLINQDSIITQPSRPRSSKLRISTTQDHKSWLVPATNARLDRNPRQTFWNYYASVSLTLVDDHTFCFYPKIPLTFSHFLKIPVNLQPFVSLRMANVYWRPR